MKQKPFAKLVALSAFFLSSSALAAVEVGDNMTLQGKAGTSTRYDSNIFDQDKNPQGHFIQNMGGDVALTKEFKAGKATVGGGVEHEWYVDSPRDDRTNFNVMGDVEGRISQAVKAFLSAEYRQRHVNRGESLTDPTAVAKSPVRYWETSGQAGLEIRQAQWSIDPLVEITNLDFRNTRQLNGLTNTQDQRDRTEYEAGARIGYDIDAQWQVFNRTMGNWREYDKTVAGFVKRDSSGIESIVGVLFRPTENVRLEAGAGYLGQEYDAANLRDADTVAAMAQADWDISEDVNFLATYRRSIAEATAATHSFRLRDVVSTKLTYQAMEPLTLNGSVKFASDEYENATGVAAKERVDDLMTIGFGADYEVFKRIFLLAGYEYANNESNAATRDYATHVGRMGAEFRF